VGRSLSESEEFISDEGKGVLIQVVFGSPVDVGSLEVAFAPVQVILSRFH
jgi:hypothetical protein